MPFTGRQFFDLFSAYNAACWPAVVALWVASLAAAVGLLSRRSSDGKAIGALLTLQWLWSGVVYHLVFFSRINPAAWFFGALFVVEALLFARLGMLEGRLSFSPPPRASWRGLGAALIAFSLAYPFLNAVEHGSVTRIPTFGLPCPTTIFTAGVLLRASAPPKSLLIVPVAWSLIGGSAAVLFNVTADYALLLVPWKRISWKNSPHWDLKGYGKYRAPQEAVGRDGG